MDFYQTKQHCKRILRVIPIAQWARVHALYVGTLNLFPGIAWSLDYYQNQNPPPNHCQQNRKQPTIWHARRYSKIWITSMENTKCSVCASAIDSLPPGCWVWSWCLQCCHPVLPDQSLKIQLPKVDSVLPGDIFGLLSSAWRFLPPTAINLETLNTMWYVNFTNKTRVIT